MLDVSREGRIGVVTLRRSHRRNAMDHDLVVAMMRAFRRLDADPKIGAILLQGEPPGFCAGSDLKYIGGISLDAMRRFEALTGDMARMIGFLEKPVVASVEGFALGGGFILAISCDLVVSSEDARWHLPEVPIGWLTPWGLKALIAKVGPVAARKLCFATEAFDGREALRLGIVDHLTAAGEATATAMALAGRLAALPQAASIATKRFFAPNILDGAEAMDVEANAVFAGNCGHPVAQMTLKRFGQSAGASNSNKGSPC